MGKCIGIVYASVSLNRVRPETYMCICLWLDARAHAVQRRDALCSAGNAVETRRCRAGTWRCSAASRAPPPPSPTTIPATPPPLQDTFPSDLTCVQLPVVSLPWRSASLLLVQTTSTDVQNRCRMDQDGLQLWETKINGTAKLSLKLQIFNWWVRGNEALLQPI